MFSLIFSFMILCILIFLFFILSNLVFSNFLKTSCEEVFECGFLTHGSSHKSFNVQVFLMMVVFICFDLELVILVIIFCAWSTFVFMGFLLFMLLTLYMEWWMGSISWNV